MKYGTVLFDLDGTLTDPKEGITRSVAYALAAFGIEVTDLDALCPFIGPPLTQGFERFYGFSPEQARQAVTVYRERFAPIGIYENQLYSGIPALLSALKTAGVSVRMATSKPEVFARKIAVYFGIEPFFDRIVGSELDGVRVEKSEVIREALRDLTPAQRAQAVMVGDRCFDVAGAAENGLPCIGVLYGYGDEAELCNAVARAADVPALQQLLL